MTVPNDFSSAVVDMLNKRKGEMLSMGPAEGETETLYIPCPHMCDIIAIVVFFKRINT